MIRTTSKMRLFFWLRGQSLWETLECVLLPQRHDCLSIIFIGERLTGGSHCEIWDDGKFCRNCIWGGWCVKVVIGLRGTIGWQATGDGGYFYFVECNQKIKGFCHLKFFIFIFLKEKFLRKTLWKILTIYGSLSRAGGGKREALKGERIWAITGRTVTGDEIVEVLSKSELFAKGRTTNWRRVGEYGILRSRRKYFNLKEQVILCL